KKQPTNTTYKSYILFFQGNGNHRDLHSFPTRRSSDLGLSRTLQSTGEYDKALAAVDEALKDAPKDAGLHARRAELLHLPAAGTRDRKSTRLNSSHSQISYAVFCLKKKRKLRASSFHHC